MPEKVRHVVTKMFPTRAIRLIALAQSFSSVGEIGFRIPFVFLLLSLSLRHSPSSEDLALSFGALYFYLMLPSVLFGWVYGPLCDEFDRIKLLIASVSVRFFLLGTLSFLSFFHQLTFFVCYAIVFLESTVAGLGDPALHSVIAEIVPEDKLSQANASVGFGDGVGYALGPFLGGVLTTVFSPGIAIFLVGGFFLVSALLTRGLLKIPREGRKPLLSPTRKILSVVSGAIPETCAGLRQCWRNPSIRGVLWEELVMGTTLGGAAVSVPALLESFFHSGALEIGGVGMISGIGSFLGGTVLLFFAASHHLSLKKSLIFISLGSGLSFFWVGFAPTVLCVALATGLAASLLTTRKPLIRKILQLNLPTEILGKGFAAANTVLCLGYIIGTLLYPRVIGEWGVAVAMGGIGLWRFLAGAILWKKLPKSDPLLLEFPPKMVGLEEPQNKV